MDAAVGRGGSVGPLVSATGRGGRRGTVEDVEATELPLETEARDELDVWGRIHCGFGPVTGIDGVVLGGGGRILKEMSGDSSGSSSRSERDRDSAKGRLQAVASRTELGDDGWDALGERWGARGT